MSSVKPPMSMIDRDRASALVEKWAPVLDYTSTTVKPIENDHSRLCTAMLLENQERYCLTEQNTVGGGVFGSGIGSYTGGQVNGVPAAGDSNYAGGDYRLPKVLIPMIRRTFPELVTNEIVGVQPMSGPVGLAFALRYKYGQNLLTQVSDNDGQDGRTDSSSTDRAVRVAALSGAELGYNYVNSMFTGASSAALSGSDEFEFNIQAQDRGIAELLKNFEATGNIPTVEVSFEKTAVEAGTRRLAAKWSVELEQDVRNMNGIDIDAELTNAMSYEIQAEIDREMVMRMAQAALNARNVSMWQISAADGRWIGERTRAFYAHIIYQANRVSVRTRRGAANFIIATPKVCAMLEMLPEFQPMSVNGNVNTSSTGIAKVGTVGGRFTVYRDTITDAQNINAYDNMKGAYPGATRTPELEYALLGYKGAEYYDTGIVYCPYIPVMVQRTIGPNDFAPRVGLLTRYGVVDNLFGAGLYYSLIVVKGLGSGFTPGDQTIYM